MGLGASRSDPGLRVLRSALVWGSTLDQTVVTETISYTLAGQQGAVLTPGGADPWGGTTARTVSDTAATSNAPRAWCSSFSPALEGGGALYQVEFYSRVHPDVTATPTRWVPALRADTPGFSPIEPLYPTSPTISGAAIDIEREGRIKAGGAGVFRRARVRKLGAYSGPWLGVRASMQAVSSIAPFIGSYSQTGSNIGLLVPPVITRRSVSAQTNLATGSAATITQGTASARPEVTPDPWIDGENALFTDGHDGYLNVTAVAAALSGTGVSWSYSAALDFRRIWKFAASGTTGGSIFRLAGTTAVLSIEQTATGLHVVRTNDAGTTTTATLPLTWIHSYAHVVTLTCDGSAVQLYVNGRAVGAPQSIGSGAATFTSGRAVGASHVAIGEWVTWGRELRAGEVTAQAETLAARRGFSTRPIQLWWGTSQRNGEFPGGFDAYPATNPNATWRLADEDQFPNQHGSLLAVQINGGTFPSMSTWGPNRGADPVNDDDVTYDPAPNRGAFGVHLGFLKNQGSGVALMHAVHNGAPISTLLPGGASWDSAVSFWDSRIAQLEAAGFVWQAAGVLNVHGEADSGTEALALDFANKLETLRSSIESEYGVTVPRVVHPRISSASSGAWINTERAGVAAWELANPASRILVDIDGLPLKSDNVHHSNAMSLEVGKRVGAFSHRVKDL
jgi:hypothetical protein